MLKMLPEKVTYRNQLENAMEMSLENVLYEIQYA